MSASIILFLEVNYETMLDEEKNKKRHFLDKKHHFYDMEASNGFEPMIRQLQCLALPLGYEAVTCYIIISSSKSKSQ